MIKNIIGMLVGREIGRNQGGNGTKGAILGTLAMSGMRRLGPLGMALGGAYVAKKAYDRKRGRSF